MTRTYAVASSTEGAGRPGRRTATPSAQRAYSWLVLGPRKRQLRAGRDAESALTRWISAASAQRVRPGSRRWIARLANRWVKPNIVRWRKHCLLSQLRCGGALVQTGCVAQAVSGG